MVPKEDEQIIKKDSLSRILAEIESLKLKLDDWRRKDLLSLILVESLHWKKKESIARSAFRLPSPT
ncbi:MAG: hypothetical protein IPL67_03735 [Ignavibacteria bacterium]|nr:hypothetical protein [Ignavibacteria bacterium]